MAGLLPALYRSAVDSGNSQNSGAGTDGLISPKVSAVLGPWASTEIYVNTGLGYHSNDARGATIRVGLAVILSGAKFFAVDFRCM